MKGGNGVILDLRRLWSLVKPDDTVAFLVLVEATKPEEPFKHTITKGRYFALSISDDDHYIIDDLVFKKNDSNWGCVCEVVNTFLLALNVESHIKTQLKRINLCGCPASRVTYKELIDDLVPNSDRVVMLDGTFFVVGVRTKYLFYPVFKKLVPVEFWNNKMNAAWFRRLDIQSEFNTLSIFISRMNDNDFYYNDIKLNNLLLRETEDGAITMSLCDYGAIEHINDDHNYQTTFPCPWAMLMFADSWFGVSEHTTDPKTRYQDNGYIRLRDKYIGLHKPYYKKYDWNLLWEESVDRWHRLPAEKKSDVAMVLRYNDRYCLGTVFLKLKEQEKELGIFVPEHTYTPLLSAPDYTPIIHL